MVYRFYAEDPPIGKVLSRNVVEERPSSSKALSFKSIFYLKIIGISELRGRVDLLEFFDQSPELNA